MRSVWNLALGILFVAGVCIAFTPAIRLPRRRGADIKNAMSFPLPGVAQRLADQTGAPLQEAERREWFFRRWFVVVASCDVMIGMSSAQVDEYWHLLLDESELYRAYSLAVCGRVIRHIEGAGGPKLEARSWVAYEEVWGTPPAADLWPRPPER